MFPVLTKCSWMMTKIIFTFMKYYISVSTDSTETDVIIYANWGGWNNLGHNAFGIMPNLTREHTYVHTIRILMYNHEPQYWTLSPLGRRCCVKQPNQFKYIAVKGGSVEADEDLLHVLSSRTCAGALHTRAIEVYIYRPCMQTHTTR